MNGPKIEATVTHGADGMMGRKGGFKAAVGVKRARIVGS